MATKTESKKASKSKGIDLTGMDLSSLVSNNPVSTNTEDGHNIVELDIRNILEDPLQPRKKDSPGFKSESIQELAQTIEVRGLKQPISVRIMPNMPGRYYINHGARRFRAFKSLGKKTIPAIIDNEYGLVDQAIENMQRSDLTSKEIALVIDQLEKSGMKRKEIAKNLGKTPGYVAQFARLNNLPAELESLFDEGEITDVTLIYEIANYYDRNPDHIPALKQWLLTEKDSITRSTWKLFKEVQDSKTSQNSSSAAESFSEPVVPEIVSAESVNTDLSDSPKEIKASTSSENKIIDSDSDDVNHDIAALACDSDDKTQPKHRFPFEEKENQSVLETNDSVSNENSDPGQKAPRPALNAVDENSPMILGHVQVIRVTYKGKEYSIIDDRVPDLGIYPYDERALFLLDEITNEIIRVDTSLDNVVLHSIAFEKKEN